jgi:hypothetical protein
MGAAAEEYVSFSLSLALSSKLFGTKRCFCLTSLSDCLVSNMNTTNIILLDGGMGHELKNRGISDGSFLAGVLANEDTSGGSAVVESIIWIL